MTRRTTSPLELRLGNAKKEARRPDRGRQKTSLGIDEKAERKKKGRKAI